MIGSVWQTRNSWSKLKNGPVIFSSGEWGGGSEYSVCFTIKFTWSPLKVLQYCNDPTSLAVNSIVAPLSSVRDDWSPSAPPLKTVGSPKIHLPLPPVIKTGSQEWRKLKPIETENRFFNFFLRWTKRNTSSDIIFTPQKSIFRAWPFTC